MSRCQWCPQPGRHRVVARDTTWWRQLLRRGPRAWTTCAEHRYQPISLGTPSRFTTPTGLQVLDELLETEKP